MTDRARRSSQPRPDGAGAAQPAGSDGATESVGSQRGRRTRRSGTAYDVALKHSDPTSLNPEYIVFTGGPVDQEPGRTSRLTWTKGRWRPITDREAHAVFWRRKAARLKRLYADREKNKAALDRLPATLEEALAEIPDELPPWDATRSVITAMLPERLLAYAAAYADIQECSLPQLIELALWRMVSNGVPKPNDFKAEYVAMRQRTYQIDREERLQATADDEDDD
ncbi:hypothetical protein [Hamadaea tsunoensis]|uniref:hypothetical protein n=1 Tax=Hamadaea tsunoensis TaxID=53368 RepID=UPI00040AF3EC|nr:hypothetical protein [Hamadaea tsunoensis]